MYAPQNNPSDKRSNSWYVYIVTVWTDEDQLVLPNLD